MLSTDNAAGAIVYEVEAGYLIHVLRAKWVSGTPVIKLGLTVGTDELVYPFTLSSVNAKMTVSIHEDMSRDLNENIYLTVTGGVAHIDIQTIKNIA